MFHLCTAAILFVVLISSPDTLFGQIAAINPHNPKIGDVITVAYNPNAKCAVIQRPAQIVLQTLILPEVGKSATLIETPMGMDFGAVFQ